MPTNTTIGHTRGTAGVAGGEAAVAFGSCELWLAARSRVLIALTFGWRYVARASERRVGVLRSTVIESLPRGPVNTRPPPESHSARGNHQQAQAREQQTCQLLQMNSVAKRPFAPSLPCSSRSSRS